MASEFITRVERDKDEPYTVIFSTDDADKYKHIEDECRKMIGHAKPTVDAVPVVRCRECKYYLPWDDATYGNCKVGSGARMKDWYCNLGERKEKTDEQED